MNALKTSFHVEKSIQSTYAGGPIQLSANGSRLATSYGKMVYLHHLGDSMTIDEFGSEEDDEDTYTSLALCPDGSSLFAACRSFGMKQWCTESKRCLKVWKPHDSPVIWSTVSPNGQYLATASSDHTVKIWSLLEGMLLVAHLKGHSGVLTCCLFHPSATSELYTASEDGTVRIWSLDNFQCLAVCKGHTSTVTSLAVSPCGNFLLSSSRDKMVNIWHLEKRRLEKSIPVYESIEAVVAFSPHPALGWQFYTGGETGTVKQWDFATGSLAREYKEPKPEGVLDETAPPASPPQIVTLLLDAHSESIVRVTSDHHALWLSAASLAPARLLIGSNQEVTDLCYIHSEAKYLAVSTNESAIRVYDVETRSGLLLKGHADMVLCLSASPAKGLFASGSKDCSARIWRADFDHGMLSGVSCIGRCEGHAEAIGAISMSHQGQAFFVITASQDRTIKRWDYLPSSRHEPLSSRYTIKAHDKDINSVDISPNDRYIATGSQDRTAKIWNAADGSLVGTASGHKRGIWSVRFSATDQSFVTSSADRTIKIWSLSSLACLKTFEGHGNSVLKALVFNRGTQIVSSGSDGLVKVWDVKSNECLATLDQHTDKIWALALSPDESVLVSGSADSSIHLWRDCSEREREARRSAEADAVLKEQEYANCIQKRDYKGAIFLALAQRQPFRLLTLLKELLNSHEFQEQPSQTMTSATTGSAQVDAILLSLNAEQLACLLQWIRDWNTHFKNYRVSHILLNLILRSYPFEQLLEIPDLKDVLQACLAYSERHYAKLDEAMIQSYMVDFALHEMNAIL